MTECMFNICSTFNLIPPTNGGFTSLILAAMNGHENCLIHLLSLGADGYTALWLIYVAENGYENCLVLFRSYGSHGAEDVNANDNSGYTALWLIHAAENGHEN